MEEPTTKQRFEFGRELVIVGRRWRTRLDERLKLMGMSQARWAALYWLSQAEGGVSQSVLAEQAGVEPATLVRIIDLLEKQKLVERRPSPTDRRINLLHLTEPAYAVVDQIEVLANELRSEVMVDIADEDLTVGLKLLRNLRIRLDQEVGSVAFPPAMRAVG